MAYREKPRVSIIMGVYNCKSKELLYNSVNSIINQSYTDWEFLICNDGSKDRTLELLHEIAGLDSRIRILSYDDNHGLSYALNECLKHAEGEYIARQDDDDESLSDRLQREVDFLDEHSEYAIVGTIADVTDDSGVWGTFPLPEKPDRYSFYWNSPFLHPSVMIRKDALDEVNGYRVSKETSRCEDYDLFMRMYAKGFIGYNIQEKLYKYRILNDPNKKYRPMNVRIEEAQVRYKGFRMLHLYPKGIIYVLKPLILGLIPQSLFHKIRKNNYSNRTFENK